MTILNRNRGFLMKPNPRQFRTENRGCFYSMTFNSTIHHAAVTHIVHANNTKMIDDT